MLRRITVMALVATTLTACGDNNALRASVEVSPDTLVAYALTGTSPNYPSGLNTTGGYNFHGTVVRVDGSGSFDVALDIAPGGNVKVLPVRVVVNSLAGTVSVGLQTPSSTFDDITRAPSGYYRPDTAITVAPGQPFVILTSRNDFTPTCLSLSTPQIYAKVVVDSVNEVTRTIHFRQVVNPNCGYRSFLTGLPSN